MADNVAITAGTGTTIATDDIAGTHFQRVKLVDGVLDSTTPAEVDASGALWTDSMAALATSTVATTAATTATVTLPSLASATGSGLDASKMAQLVIQNPTGSGQAITGATLRFSDTIGGTTVNIDYTLPVHTSATIATNTTGQFYVPLWQGTLPNVSLILTAAGNFTAAQTITVRSQWYGPASPFMSTGTMRLYTRASASLGLGTTSSAAIYVGNVRTLQYLHNITASAGTSPTLQVQIEGLGADGIWYWLIQTAARATPANTDQAKLTLDPSGPTAPAANTPASAAQMIGSFGQMFPEWIRVSHIIGGTATPTVTFSAQMYGRTV